MKPDIMQMDSFCEGIYDVLDPGKKGYVDLQLSQRYLPQLSPAVVVFVKRVLETCEEDIDPSQIAFKEDVITRLMMAVDDEWRSLRAEPPATKVSVDTSTAPAIELPLPPPTAAQPTKQVASIGDSFLARLKDKTTLIEKLRTSKIPQEMKDCTFTPAITRKVAPFPLMPTRKASMDAGTSTEDFPSGARLQSQVHATFKLGLRQHPRSAGNRKRTHFDRSYLMHRINEADKFWNLSYNT